MKQKIIVKNYDVSSKKIQNRNIKVALISDIHFNPFYNHYILNSISNKIRQMDVDYIFIVGDIIDWIGFVDNKEKMYILYNWLSNLGNINSKKIPVIISLGNHDLGRNSLPINFRNKIVKKELFNRYINELKKTGIHLLDNSCYEDNFICVTGFTQPKDSFNSKNSLEIEKNYFNKINKNLLNNSCEKLKVALIHNPINITNEFIKDKLKNFDLVFSGHMHNGMMLEVMDKIFKGNYGIISPDKKFFPKVARGKLALFKDKYLIISGGIIKLSFTSGIFRYGNIFYPMEIDLVNITN